VDELIVIVEEWKVDLTGMGHIPHRNYFVELWLIFFEDVDIFSHLFVSIVLILNFEVDVSVGVNIIEYRANLGERR
jgi:hypothetical protein